MCERERESKQADERVRARVFLCRGAAVDYTDAADRWMDGRLYILCLSLGGATQPVGTRYYIIMLMLVLSYTTYLLLHRMEFVMLIARALSTRLKQKFAVLELRSFIWMEIDVLHACGSIGGKYGLLVVRRKI